MNVSPSVFHATPGDFPTAPGPTPAPSKCSVKHTGDGENPKPGQTSTKDGGDSDDLFSLMSARIPDTPPEPGHLIEVPIEQPMQIDQSDGDSSEESSEGCSAWQPTVIFTVHQPEIVATLNLVNFRLQERQILQALQWREAELREYHFLPKENWHALRSTFPTPSANRRS